MYSLVPEIEALFLRHGEQVYDGSRREPVSATRHALQCAQLAEWAHADDTLVAAALLHDIGHFIAAESDEHIDDRHELQALPFLAPRFGPAVLEPIRLHVAAKRYLVATDPAYLGGLSSASVHSLGLQGGAMSADELTTFEATPFCDGRSAAAPLGRPGQTTQPGHAVTGLLPGPARRPADGELSSSVSAACASLAPLPCWPAAACPKLRASWFHQAPA